MSGLKLIPALAGGGWQRRYCEHPPSVMLGIKFQASAFWVGGCLHPLFYIAPMGHVRARGSAGRAPRSHRGGRGFESLLVHHLMTPLKSEPLWFGLDGVFVIIPAFKRFLRPLFLFAVCTKKKKNANLKTKKLKADVSEPISLLYDFYLPACFKAYSCSFCSGVLYCSFLCGRFVL